jgi:hypothetical protein
MDLGKERVALLKLFGLLRHDRWTSYSARVVEVNLNVLLHIRMPRLGLRAYTGSCNHS